MRVTGSSPDGKKIFAAAPSGFMSAPGDQTSLGTPGSIAGSFGDALTLRHLGSGTYTVLNFTNTSGNDFTVR